MPAIGFGAMSLGGNIYHSQEGTQSGEEYLRVLFVPGVVYFEGVWR